MAVATREYLQLVRDSGIRGTRVSAAEARRAILLRSPASELSRDQPLRFRRIGLRAALQRRSILAQGLTCRLRGSPLAGRDRNLEEPDGEPGGADLSRLRARNGSPVGKCEVALSIVFSLRALTASGWAATAR